MSVPTAAPTAEPQLIVLVNPDTGVRFDYRGWWLRANPATDRDVKANRAKFRGDRVWLPLPPGVQAQLDAGHLQVDTEYRARQEIEESAGLHAGQLPMPSPRASREKWVEYAVSQGMSRDEAAGVDVKALRGRFTAPAFDPDAPPDLDLLNDTP
jgi:hypothetical protein